MPQPQLPNDFKLNELVKTSQHEKDIETLHKKVDRCYTKDDHEEFAKKVAEIVVNTIQLDVPRGKIKTYAKEAAKDFFDKEMWKQKTFWIPTVLSIAAALIAFFKK